MATLKSAAIILSIAISSMSYADNNSLYFSTLGSYTAPDSDRDADYGAGVQVLLGQPLGKRWGLEYGLFASAVTHDTDPDHDFQYSLGIDLAYAWNRGGISPFLLLGAGAIYDDIRREEETSPFVEAGLGIVLPLHESGAGIRAEGRYVVDINDESVPGEDYLSDIRANLGLQVPFSTANATATAEIGDFDNDGVKDNFDQCPNTPAGVEVGPEGCAIDLDKDGVLNEKDKCPNTPEGVVVDADGCARDTDGDGVPDHKDECPNTPKGLEVDEKGCARDSDDDGCLDVVDLCPDTMKGMAVGSDGCAIPQVTVLEGVNFAFDSDQLTAKARGILDGVARTLLGQPDAKFNIDGHTDSKGADAYNKELSQRRAESVRRYLFTKGIPIRRMIARGFGESRPVASNSTSQGRAQNRRVELELL